MTNSSHGGSGMEFDYRVSVIVPVYNKERLIEKAVESLIRQTMPSTDYEILLIDDGSTDSSPKICDTFAELFDNVKVVHKANGGLSDARNCGIDHASGKYLMYLDADDSLQNDTLLAVADFFDKHYDEVDLVTYPCMMDDGNELTPLNHYRYKVLKRSGIYDLKDDNNIFAAITQIYVCVKNQGRDNVRFSPNRDFRHEDQKYITDVLLHRLKVGFCDSGAYHYYRQPDGLTGTRFHAYYLFENTMDFWEEEFAKFDESVPRYLQALYLSDIAWKTSSDILLPYHYSDDKFERAVKRIIRLLDRVDSTVIARHPAIDKFQAAFFLRMKDNADTRIMTGKDALALIADDEIAYFRNKIQIVLLKSSFGNGKMVLKGFLKSPCFAFGDKPALVAVVSREGKIQQVEIPLEKSSWSYHKAKLETNEFWNFKYSFNVNEAGSLRFKVKCFGETYSTDYHFMPRAVFSHEEPKRYAFCKNEYLYRFKNNVFIVRKRTKEEIEEQQARVDATFKKYGEDIAENRKRARHLLASNKQIWLYHDCHGVEKNNGFYQFEHDFPIDDGVERYYVVNDPLESRKHLFTRQQLTHVIQFGSDEHKTLFLAANKIVTAYVEQGNWMPFTPKEMKYYTDIFNAKVTYLQHGVLHSHMPWKYSLDRLLIDFEVVSTQFEVDNLCENYGFYDKNLIKAGMPRYDFIDSSAKPGRKILFAPSWRSFLVHPEGNGTWSAVQGVLEESRFYKEIIAFLNHPQLAALLEKHDYTLELKLHPILAELYKDHFAFSSTRVKMAADVVNDDEYAVFITDYSSYRFDFVYLKRAILYFLPDEDMFKSGMCAFRETDLPLEGTFGDMARTAAEAVDLLSTILENGGKPKPEYAAQMDGFFLYDDFNQRDRIYKALRGKAKADKTTNEAEQKTPKRYLKKALHLLESNIPGQRK